MATIQKRGSKFRVRIRRQGYQTLTQTFLSRATAQAWARKTESELERQTYVDTTLAQNTKVSDVLYRYQVEVLPDKKGSYRELSRLRLLRHSFGHLKLSELHPHHISLFQKQRLKAAQPATVRRDLNVLSSVLSYTTKDWGIYLPKGNPFAYVRLPKVSNDRERRLSNEEEAKVIRALSYSPLVQDIVKFALETSMRRSEMTAIKAEDMDLDRRLLQIPDSKNNCSRVIPLSMEAIGILARNKNGFDVKPDSITQAFSRACKRCGISGLRFHDLRHEATSRFFEKGLNIVEVASITGHKDVRMLMRYTHLKAENLLDKID